MAVDVDYLCRCVQRLWVSQRSIKSFYLFLRFEISGKFRSLDKLKVNGT